jgi:hypothetical protein
MPQLYISNPIILLGLDKDGGEERDLSNEGVELSEKTEEMSLGNIELIA